VDDLTKLKPEKVEISAESQQLILDELAKEPVITDRLKAAADRYKRLER
jgi:hypothetical protein